jgi:hypothetical protein
MRDQLILCNALAYAILTIERLPRRQQEYSNKEDMKLVLEHLASNFLGVEHWMEVARNHMDGTFFKDMPPEEEEL